MKIKKSDIILICMVLCAAGICLLLYMRVAKEKAGSVVVQVDGEVQGTYRLTEDREVKIGDTNVFVIENQTVRMKEAECPDQICVRHKPISKNKESIVCLPNKVVIEVTGGKETGLDSIAD